MILNRFDVKYPFLHAILAPDTEDSEAHRNRLDTEYSRNLADSEHIIPNGKLYLNSRLHDSRVESIELKDQTLRIRLNDIFMEDLADALIRHFHLSCPRWNRAFPLILNFHRIRRYQIYAINRNNKLLPVKNATYLPLLKEWLYDEAHRIAPGDITLGMIFWTRSRRKNDHQYLLLQIECQALTFIEEQHQAFIHFFEGRHLDIFDHCWKERLSGKYLDTTVIAEIIKDFYQ